MHTQLPNIENSALCASSHVYPWALPHPLQLGETKKTIAI